MDSVRIKVRGCVRVGVRVCDRVGVSKLIGSDYGHGRIRVRVHLLYGCSSILTNY